MGNLPGAAAPAVLGTLVTREITWVGAYRFVEEITDAVSALHDGLDVEPLITHEFGIAAAAEAFTAAAAPDSSKVLLRFTG
ncbi:hypothetical protein [Actinophytocola sp.]|uniref:hypothetical protein n=1 Tax=Actinophytocola sp. TaxID=1872138 RepID=UPI002ED20840